MNRRQRKWNCNEGVNPGAMLAQGGFDIDKLKIIRSRFKERRHIVLVKEREGGLVGKAYNALLALHQIASQLTEFQIKILLSN